MAQRRSCLGLALVCLLMAPAGAQAQTVLTDTADKANASSVDDYWLTCGKTTLCQDATACCAIWGVCGYTDRFCGQNCLNGACKGANSPPPPANGGRNPSDDDDAPPNFDPNRFSDALVRVNEGEVALAGCIDAGWIITRVENAIYGDVAALCNSTLSHNITDAACVGQTACMVPAVNAIFDDPCPTFRKSLQFGYRCQALLESSSDPPLVPPPSDINPPPNTFSPPPNTGGLPPSPRSSPRPPSPRPPSLRPPSPRPPSLRPPSPRPPSPQPNDLPLPSNAQTSKLWGRNGELYSTFSRVSDFSQAGYAANDQPIPTYPAKFNVRDFGAQGDGRTDDSKAFISAVNAASKEAAKTGQGVAVLVPAGRYKITKTVTISQSNVVLRGAGVGSTTLTFPLGLSEVYGSGQAWAFGGTWLTILGNNPDSKDTRNFVTTITATVPKGSRRITVASTNKVRVGQWLRVFVTTPNNSFRRRSLLATEATASPQQLLQPGLRLRRGLRQAAASDTLLVARLFEDPSLQAGLNASFVAEAQKAEALAANPDKVPAQWFEPNATNPLGMDPWLLAVGRFAANALLADSDDGDSTNGDNGGDRVPGLALDGTLDAYIYGENIADSGRNGGVYPKDDHIRFLSRVSAVGPNWIEFERSLPYELRLVWQPVVHTFNPTVQNSGFEMFNIEFPWSSYFDHLNVKGYNALGIYSSVNCWMRQIRVVNADNAFIVNGADFVTVTDVQTDITRTRSTPNMGDRNGHHGLWIQQSTNVLMTRFAINYRWFHDLSLAIFSESCVYANGRAADINIDSHRGGTHNNLLSNIDAGKGTRTFQSGGANFRGAHSGSNVTWWNVYKTNRQPIDLPACNFGPRLFFAGNWASPSSMSDDGGERRRSLMTDGSAADSATATPALVDGEGSSSSSNVVHEADGGMERAHSLSLLPYCPMMSWRVEEVDNGMQLWPNDLYSAMVTARKEHRVFF